MEMRHLFVVAIWVLLACSARADTPAGTASPRCVTLRSAARVQIAPFSLSQRLRAQQWMSRAVCAF